MPWSNTQMALSSVDIRIISLKQICPLHASLKHDFGNHDVQLSPAVDMRHVSTKSLIRSGMITLSAADTLDAGRKWHKELTSTGTVGLYQSNRLLLQDGVRPVLVFEEDCEYDMHRLKTELERLVKLGDAIDVAVFGAWQDRSNRFHRTNLDNWVRLEKGSFWYTHCVYYSASGRKKMSKYMSDPQEIQYDSYLAFLGSRQMLNLYIETSKNTAWQSLSTSSTLQTDMCLLCMLPGSPPLRALFGIIGVIICYIAYRCIIRTASTSLG